MDVEVGEEENALFGTNGVLVASLYDENEKSDLQSRRPNLSNFLFRFLWNRLIVRIVAILLINRWRYTYQFLGINSKNSLSVSCYLIHDVVT